MNKAFLRFALAVGCLTLASHALAVELATPAPDITVAQDGTGQFKTIQAAVQSIPKTNLDRIVIFIKPGTYHEKISINAPFLTLLGQDRATTTIEFSQLDEDFTKSPDDIGRAVLNINANDIVLQNLTIKNTNTIVGPHAMTVFGKADRTVIVDCNLLSDGADTLSLWQGATGRHYHARCSFRGAVDFVCPRGWCYIADSSFTEVKKGSAAIWHDGSKGESQKFVLRNCKFDGTVDFTLARHHLDAQFFLLDCAFSKALLDKPIRRVIYPLNGATPTPADIEKNTANDKLNKWGERSYFHNCHREGGDFPWFADNLGAAKGAPTPEQITARWAFDNTWDPESTAPPKVISTTLVSNATELEIKFGESVTVKGRPRLSLPAGSASYSSGSGTDTLRFALAGQAQFQGPLPFSDGQILATESSATIRQVSTPLPPLSQVNSTHP